MKKNLTQLCFLALMLPTAFGFAQSTRIQDLAPGGGDANIEGLSLFKDKLYFEANTTGNTSTNLYTSDGTSIELEFGDESWPAIPGNFHVTDSIFYFTIVSNAIIWHDGTDLDFLVEFTGMTNAAADNLIAFNNELVFTADNDTSGREAFAYNYATKTTRLLGDINPGTAPSIEAGGEGFVAYNDKLYFAAEGPASGIELYAYDGDTVGLVSDIHPSGSSSPRSLTVIGDALYFIANSSDTEENLYKLSSTGLETITTGYQFSGPIYNINGELFISAGTDEIGLEPHKLVDNTLELIQDLHANDGAGIDENSSNPKRFTAFKNKVVFVANDGVHGEELWIYDGVECTLIADVNPGAANSSPGGASNAYDFTVYYGIEAEGEIYFAARGADTDGQELYRTDGETIELIEDINTHGGSNPDQFVVWGNDLFFVATDDFYGRELYKLDCSAERIDITVTSCGPYVSPYSGTIYEKSGYYSDYFVMPCGEEREVRLTLIIPEFPEETTAQNDSVLVEDIFDSYQWIDENEDPISGADKYAYVPASEGSYAVIMTKGECADTTLFFDHRVTGLLETTANTSFLLAPNPVNNELNVQLKGDVNGTYRITDLLGNTLIEGSISEQASLQVNFEFPAGIYLFSLMNDEGTIQTTRFTKVN